jgi:hypothetical protein
LTFTISGLSPRSSTTASDWMAKASLSSTSPISYSFKPARSSALCVAETGPIPMIRGGTPAALDATMRAIRFNLSSRALSAPISNTAAVPSLRPDELTAVRLPKENAVSALGSEYGARC